MRFHWWFSRRHPAPQTLGPTDEDRRRLEDSGRRVTTASEQVARQTREVQRLVTGLGRQIEANHLAERLRKAFQDH